MSRVLDYTSWRVAGRTPMIKTSCVSVSVIELEHYRSVCVFVYVMVCMCASPMRVILLS